MSDLLLPSTTPEWKRVAEVEPEPMELSKEEKDAKQKKALELDDDYILYLTNRVAVYLEMGNVCFILFIGIMVILNLHFDGHYALL